MKKECAAFVATGALLFGGCSIGPIDLMPPTGEREGTDLTTLPDRLPNKIKKLAGQAVLVVNQGPEGNIRSMGSGLRLSDTKIVTAGHVFIGEDEKTAPDMLKCGTMAVRGLSRNNIAVEKEQQPVGQSDLIQKFVATRKMDRSIPDVALARIKSDSYSHTTPIKVAHQPVQPGDHVYISSYQPVSNATRDPQSNVMITGEYPRGLQSPAIIGGIVLGTESNNRIKVAANLKSYGEITDATLRGGASGSGVLNEKGEIVGDVIELRIYGTGTVPAKTTESSAMGTKIANNSKDVQIQEVIVQGISTTLMQSMSDTLRDTQHCEP